MWRNWIEWEKQTTFPANSQTILYNNRDQTRDTYTLSWFSNSNPNYILVTMEPCLLQMDDPQQPLTSSAERQQDQGTENPFFLHNMDRRPSSKNPYEYF